VDWQQLLRWDIDPSRLPNEVILLNRPASFYRANRMVVWSAVVFILAQAVTIGTLFVNIRRRKNADAALQTQAKSLATTNADLERANLSLIGEMQERRQAEEQLRQAQKIEAVGRLAGGIAHDFNNLLTVIASYSELALDSLPEDHPVHAQIVEIKRASERAASLTQQLLAFSRKQVLQPTVVGLNTVVTGVEPMLRRLIGEDVALTTRLAPDLLSVMVDPGQIEQVIVNLAVNARDAMPRGGQLTIETMNADVAPRDSTRYAAAMVPARYVLLAVSDSGHGMDAETKARIFEPFFTTKPAGAARDSASRWSTGSSSRAAAGSGSTASRGRAPSSRSTSRPRRRALRGSKPAGRRHRNRPMLRAASCSSSRTKRTCVG
jgi:signal transduction histidine kinase